MCEHSEMMDTSSDSTDDFFPLWNQQSAKDYMQGASYSLNSVLGGRDTQDGLDLALCLFDF
jgi:hypothetical protein